MCNETRHVGRLWYEQRRDWLVMNMRWARIYMIEEGRAPNEIGGSVPLPTAGARNRGHVGVRGTSLGGHHLLFVVTFGKFSQGREPTFSLLGWNFK